MGRPAVFWVVSVLVTRFRPEGRSAPSSNVVAHCWLSLHGVWVGALLCEFARAFRIVALRRVRSGPPGLLLRGSISTDYRDGLAAREI